MRIQLRERVQACVKAAKSLDEFIQAVAAHNIKMLLHHDEAGVAIGVSFELKGQRFKSSQLAQSLALSGLSKTLEQNQKQGKEEQQAL